MAKGKELEAMSECDVILEEVGNRLVEPLVGQANTARDFLVVEELILATQAFLTALNICHGRERAALTIERTLADQREETNKGRQKVDAAWQALRAAAEEKKPEGVGERWMPRAAKDAVEALATSVPGYIDSRVNLAALEFAHSATAQYKQLLPEIEASLYKLAQCARLPDDRALWNSVILATEVTAGASLCSRLGAYFSENAASEKAHAAIKEKGGIVFDVKIALNEPSADGSNKFPLDKDESVFMATWLTLKFWHSLESSASEGKAVFDLRKPYQDKFAVPLPDITSDDEYAIEAIARRYGANLRHHLKQFFDKCGAKCDFDVEVTSEMVFPAEAAKAPAPPAEAAPDTGIPPSGGA